MAIYDNRYYPDSRQVTWADLNTDSGEYMDSDYVVSDYVALEPGGGLTWAQGTRDWHTWTNSNVSWSYTTNTAIDLGTIRTGYPISSAQWDQTQDYGLTISYSVSDDNVTYTNVSAGLLTGRYIKTVATTQASWLSRLETQIFFDTRQEIYTNVNTSSLSGTVNGRVLPLATIGNIVHVSSQNTIGSFSSTAYDIDVISANSTSFTFVVKDLDTWGKANVDVSGLDLVIQGFPQITANATTGTVNRI